MTKEIGTLKELGVKPGDVVECVDNGGLPWWTTGQQYNILNRLPTDTSESAHKKPEDLQPAVTFRIISRAAGEPDDSPKLWRDMSPEEKGALLLAEYECRVIQVWENGKWVDNPVAIHAKFAYRVKPEPVVKTVVIYTGNVNGEWAPHEDLDDTHRITFDLIDGKPDCNSIKMEEI